MPFRPCPVENCQNECLPSHFVCGECGFLIERQELSLVFSTRAAAKTATHPGHKQYLQDQAAAYMPSAIHRAAERRLARRGAA